MDIISRDQHLGEPIDLARVKPGDIIEFRRTGLIHRGEVSQVNGPYVYFVGARIHFDNPSSVLYLVYRPFIEMPKLPGAIVKINFSNQDKSLMYVSLNPPSSVKDRVWTSLEPKHTDLRSPYMNCWEDLLTISEVSKNISLIRSGEVPPTHKTW